jgi:hypothetical protein
MPPSSASRPSPGAAGSPAPRPRATPGSVDGPPRPPRRSRPSSARRRPGHFAVSGESVSWTGPSGDWGLRRMVLHYAHLCAAAGGVDAFLIGSEMRGLTTIRSGPGSYPAVQAFRTSPRMCAAILGRARRSATPPTGRSTSATTPGDGSGDVFFHLDPLWADAGDRFRRHRQLHAALRLARRVRASRRARGLARDLRPGLSAGEHRGRRGLRLVLCQRGRPRRADPHADHRRRPRQALGLPLQGPARAGGRTRISTGRAGWRARRPRPGSRSRSRSASPSSAVPRSTAAPTSRTSSSTRSPRRAPCRISRGAGATTRSSARISRRLSLLERGGQQPGLPSTAAAWSISPNAPPGPGTRGPTRSFPN